MTMDLWMLVAAVGLAWVQIVVAAVPMILADMGWALGNREDDLERAPWAARALRASENMNENLPLFAILVLVANVSGSADSTTALGAQIFVGARALHAVVYMVGIGGLRTALWLVSVVGMLMIASSLW